MRQLHSKDRPRAVYTSILSPSFWFLFYGATRDRFCIIMIQEQHHRTSVRLRPSSADRFRQILGCPRQDLKKNLCELYIHACDVPGTDVVMYTSTCSTAKRDSSEDTCTNHPLHAKANHNNCREPACGLDERATTFAYDFARAALSPS